MKINYFYQYFGTNTGSWSTRVYELTKRWAEIGAEVTVITAPYDKSDIIADGLVSVKYVGKVKVIIINSGDSNRFSFFKRVYRAIIFSILSSWFSVKNKSDLNIASSGPITILVPAVIAKVFRGTPYVFEVRDLWPDGAIELGIISNKLIISMALFFEKICYKFSNLIVACSDGMKNKIFKKVKDVNVLTIPNACDNVLFNNDENNNFDFPNFICKNDKILIYAGSLGLMDSCIEIIEGFNEVEVKDNIKIVFIGDGSERNYLEKRVSDLALQDHIKFIGLIPKKQVVEWYKISIASFVVFKDYSVLSTSSPNKMFDSLAAGKPIIQNTGGWIFDLVEEHKCGVNVIPNSSKSMSNAIKKCVNEKEFLKKASVNCRKISNSKFNIDDLAQLYFKNLKKLTCHI